MIKNALAQISLFNDLSEDQLNSLAIRAVAKTYPKNVVLISEGERGGSLYFIVSGLIKIYTSDENGREVQLDLLGTNDYFGELALLDDAPRSASAITVESCQLVSVSRDGFMECLQANSSMAIRLLTNLAQRLRRQNEKTKDMVLLDVYQRLIKFLRENVREENALNVVTGFSHRDLAEQVYASREMITLLLNELKQGGYIETDRKRIVFLKPFPANR